MVSNKRSSGLKVEFSVLVKQSGQEAEGPCVPIILCVSLAYTDLEVEQKWHTLQVASVLSLYEKGIKNCCYCSIPAYYLLLLLVITSLVAASLTVASFSWSSTVLRHLA